MAEQVHHINVLLPSFYEYNGFVCFTASQSAVNGKAITVNIYVSNREHSTRDYNICITSVCVYMLHFLEVILYITRYIPFL